MAVSEDSTGKQREGNLKNVLERNQRNEDVETKDSKEGKNQIQTWPYLYTLSQWLIYEASWKFEKKLVTSLQFRYSFCSRNNKKRRRTRYSDCDTITLGYVDLQSIVKQEGTVWS